MGNVWEVCHLVVTLLVIWRFEVKYAVLLTSLPTSSMRQRNFLTSNVSRPRK